MNILITGTSKGIGKSIVKAFSKQSDHCLFLVSKDSFLLNELKNECKILNPDNEVFTFDIDLNKSEDIDRLSDEINSVTESLDILINNAGVLFNRDFQSVLDDEIEKMFQINFLSPAKIIRNFIPLLKKSPAAHVINIGSMGGFQGSLKFAGLAYYSASKAAIANLTECLAAEYANTKISFNCLALGSVHTEMFEKAFPGFDATFTSEQMADFIMKFSLTGHQKLNGKVIPIVSESDFLII